MVFFLLFSDTVETVFTGSVKTTEHELELIQLNNVAYPSRVITYTVGIYSPGNALVV